MITIRQLRIPEAGEIDLDVVIHVRRTGRGPTWKELPAVLHSVARAAWCAAGHGWLPDPWGET